MIKRLIVCGIVAGLLVGAIEKSHAQQIANKNYNIVLSLDDINAISDALQLAPMGKAFPVISKLREQVLAQQPKPETAPAVAPAKAKPEVKNEKPTTTPIK